MGSVGKVVKLVVFTALVFVATVVLQIYTPATRGYFNLGETAIYAIAAITPPLETAIAAGVGSAIADLVTGYPYFAPGTLVIKFCEGFVVSYLALYLRRRPYSLAKVLSVIASLTVGAVITTLGIFKLSGVAELTSVPISILGFKATLISGKINLSPILWCVIGAVITVALLYAVLVKGRENVTLAVSMLIGGIIMVTGYFLYEYFFTNPIVNRVPPMQAIFEVPVNFGQALVGLSVALPIASFISKATGGKLSSE